MDYNNPAQNFYLFDLGVVYQDTVLYLVENRQFTSNFDRGSPGWNDPNLNGGGILLWRITKTQYNFDRIDLVEADSTASEANAATDIFRPNGPFPYLRINDFSTPATTQLLPLQPSQYGIDNYTLNGNSITVTLRTGWKSSNALEATAFNGSRKLVRDLWQYYHLVYESAGEIYYHRGNNNNWSRAQRISRIVGNNHYPAISEPMAPQNDYQVSIVWQQGDGSNNTLYFHRSTTLGYTWSDSNIVAIDSNIVMSDPQLPTLARLSENEIIVVYRAENGNLKWVYSNSKGAAGSWTAPDSIVGSALNSPSVAPGTTPWNAGIVVLAYATDEIPNDSEIHVNYYDAGWNNEKNLTSDLPSNLTQHANPSIAFSHSLGYFTHIAWDAYDSFRSAPG